MFRSLLASVVPTKASGPVLNRLICQKCGGPRQTHFRGYSQKNGANPGEASRKRMRSTVYYMTAAGIVTVGMSYAAVPLYRMFCQAYSYGGTTAQSHDGSKVEAMKSNKTRAIKVKFNADKAANMRWNFKPQQSEITVSHQLKRRFWGNVQF